MTEPHDQWWVISGDELLKALHRAHTGDIPEIVYLEVFANSKGDWPCANYTAPTTCLTAHASESAKCDYCRSL